MAHSHVLRKFRTEENGEVVLLIERGSDDFAQPWHVFIMDFKGRLGDTSANSVGTYSGCIDDSVVKDWASNGEHSGAEAATIIRNAVLQEDSQTAKVLFSFLPSKTDASVYEFVLKVPLDAEGKMKQRMAVVRMRLDPVSMQRFLNAGVQEADALRNAVHRLSKQNEELRQVCDSDMKKLEKLVEDSVEREKKLYASFMQVLNAKKQRIAQLETDLSAQVKSEDQQDSKREEEPDTGHKRPGRPKKAAATKESKSVTKPKAATQRGGRVFRRPAAEIKRSESDLLAETETTTPKPAPANLTAMPRLTRSSSKKQGDMTEFTETRETGGTKASSSKQADLPSESESDADSNATTLSGMEVDSATRSGRRSDSD